MIIALDNLSPQGNAAASGVAYDDYKGQTPALSAWSDMAFLQFADDCNNSKLQPTKLSSIFRVKVVNPESVDITNEAIPDKTQATSWASRVTFTPPADDATQLTDNNKAFYALLYTPNVRGAAWMLVQHKDKLGLKYIDEIGVWFPSSSGGFANMYIHMADWQAPNRRSLEQRISYGNETLS